MNITSIHRQHTVGSRFFTQKGNLFVSTMSDLDPDFSFRDVNGAPSFFMQNDLTGEIREFRFVMQELNPDHSVSALFFRCSTPTCRHLEVRIFHE